MATRGRSAWLDGEVRTRTFCRVRADRSPRLEVIAVEVEPVAVWRRATGLQHVVEGPEAPTGMVEDAIKDHAHAALVTRIQQRAERALTAEQRVDRQVVVGVIPVIRGGLE